MPHRHLLASLMLVLFAASASAEEVRLYRPNESVNPNEVAAILDGSKAPAPKMRSIRLLDDVATPAAAQKATDAASQPGKEPAADDNKPSSLALPVQFAFDSSDILPAARPQLDSLAEGIRQLPDTRSVVIEGHTDARGAERYNDDLSSRRADAVKRYLVSRHGIAPERLRTEGMGKQALLKGLDPLAPENRRVQFRGE